ncbi:MAG TPA: hemagglutinin repeat-containing protein [Cellvibrio sp.]|nr:hemagglutinin repeat-containing protein [Cellvibrio sp.]
MPYFVDLGFFFPDKIWLDSFDTIPSTIQAGGNLTGTFTGTLENVNLHRTLDGAVSETRNQFVLADHSNIANAANNTLQNTSTNASGSNLVTVEQQTVNVGNTVNVNATTQQFGTNTEKNINSNTGTKTVDRALGSVEQINSNATTAQIDGTRTGVDNITSQTGGTSVSGGSTSVENATSTNTPVALENGNTDAPPVAVVDNNGATPVDTQNPGTDPLDPDAQPVVNPITPPANNGNGTSVPEVISYNPTQNLQLPTNNGMFVVNTTPQSQYLVETNPILTDYLNFIGTDYLLDRLGYDPAELQRRLGDAFYETRLLRDGLFNLFGQRYLTDQNTGLAFTSDTEQFQYLMDNAIAASEALELSVGIALSAEQVAQLTHDIVWLVEQDVNGEKVLAPVYYASAARAGDLDNKGALMTGQNVSLSADSGMTNTGRLIGQHDLTLRTQQALQNTGTISADNFVLLDAGSITNTRDKVGNSGNIASGRAGTVQLISRGDINNDSRINGGDLLLKSDTGSLTNSGSLSANRDLVAIAQRDIINTVVTDKTGERVGSIESGRNLSLITREGDISNRAAITTDNPYGHTTRVTVGTAPRINAGGDMTLDSGRDVLLTASNLRSGNDMTLNAARDIQVENAANESHFVGKDYKGKVNQSSRVEHVGSSLAAGGDMTMNAGRDVNLLGTDVTAQGNIGLTAERDINLEAVADTVDSEFHRKRHDSIKNTVTHVQTTLAAGGDASMTAGQDINMIGSTLTAQGDASLHAERDTNLVAVNDSEYHYEYEKKKKSFGRSRTRIDETLHTENVGSAVIAGGNVTVNATLNDDDGSIAMQDSRNVLLHGSTLQGGGDVIVGAGENILVTANTEEHLERHENKKSGFGGLTGKGRSDTQAQTVQIGSVVDAGNDAVLLSGNNLTVAGSTVVADNSVELHAGLTSETGDLNILALQDDSFSESKTHKKSFGIDISSDFVSFSKERDNSNDGTASTNAASVILAGNNITGNAAQDVNVVGSVLDAGNNLSLDGGRNVIITAGKNAESAGSEHKNRRDGIGLDGDDNGISVFAGNETRSNREQLNQNTVAASYLNAGNDVTVSAGNDLLVSGSDVNAGRNLDLSAVNNATINASQEQLDSETKSSFTRDGLTVTANHNIGQAIDAIGNIGKGDNAISNASEVMRAMDGMNNVAPSGSAFLGQTTTSDKQQTQQTTARGSNLNAQGDVIVHAGNTTNINATNVNAGRDIRITGTDVLIDDAQNTQTTNTMHDSQQVGVTLQATQGNASLTAGFSKAESDLEQVAVTTTGSTFNAGQDINIHATNDLSITGSDLTANRNIHLQGDNDVTIKAGQGYTTSQLDEEHLSAGAGINFGSNGIGFTAYVGAGENDLDREYVNHRNSHITAKDTLTVVSGNDTTLSGANLLASDLNMDVGNNLHAESLQDTGSVDGKRWDASGSITVGAGVSGGASVGYGETDGSRAWVTEQTSLIGTESVNINVGNHTQVDGALIANIKDDGSDGGNLNLDTRTLAFKDLQDHDKEESNYLSIGFSTGGNPGANANTGASPDSEDSSWKVEGSHYELDREQTTRATIGQGNVTVREDAETGSDSTTGLNRDTQLAQEVTKDKERDIDLYVSSSAIDSAKGLAASGDENTLNQWKDNVVSVADPDAWKNVATQGTQVVVVGAAVAIDEDISIKGINDAIAHRNAIQQSVTVLETEASTPEQRKDAAEYLVRNRVNWDTDNPQAVALRDDMAESLGQLMLTDPAKAEYALQLFAQVVQESEQPGNNIYSVGSKLLPELLAVLGVTTMVATTQTSLDDELAQNVARQLGNTDANGLRALEDLRSEQQVFGRNLSDAEIYARLQPGEAYQREDGTVLVRTEDGYEWTTYASNTHTSQYAILTPSELGQSGGYQAYDGDKPTSLTTPVADNLGTNNTQTLPATQDNYVGGYEAADQLPTDTAGGTATPVVPITAMMSENGDSNISNNNRLADLGRVRGSYSAIEPGPLDDNIAGTFSGGQYQVVKLEKDTILYRAGTADQPLGQFFSLDAPTGVVKTRIDKAVLPVWPGGATSPIDTFFEIKIPAGTEVYVGEVGSQGGIYVGGTQQIVVPKPWTIEGVEVIKSGGLE